MTNQQEKAKKLAKLLNAFADRKQLQFLNDNGYWYDYAATIKDIAEEFFTIEGIQIRIKPETKRVPLTKDDLVDRIKEGKTMWIQLDFRIALITDFHDDTNGDNRVYFQCDQQSYSELMNYTFLDNSPCYKEVEDVA